MVSSMWSQTVSFSCAQGSVHRTSVIGFLYCCFFLMFRILFNCLLQPIISIYGNRITICNLWWCSITYYALAVNPDGEDSIICPFYALLMYISCIELYVILVLVFTVFRSSNLAFLASFSFVGAGKKTSYVILRNSWIIGV